MEPNKNNNVKENVEKLITYNFSVTKCPIKIYKKFVEFCKQECSDNYAFGLKLLLDGVEGNVKEALLFQQYIELKERIEALEQDMLKMSGAVNQTGPKTMGSGGQK